MEVSIDDDGGGITSDDRAHVFELFFTTKKGGTGLGLPLTLQIVEAHGGTIRCESRGDGDAETGTRFVLWWPRWAEDEPQESQAS